MKYAILADIHGNSIALEAVLKAVQGVDAYLFLGDYCAIGPDPIGVLERITSLENAYFVRGNTDHYITNHYNDYPPPTIAEALHDAPKMAVLAEMSRSFSWTQGMITAAAYFDWLKSLPVEIRITLPDKTCLLLVHAQPGAYDGMGITPVDSDSEIAERFACEDDLILVGHTHWPQERFINGKHIVNPGSIGNPVGEEIVARYAILNAEADGYQIEFQQIVYNVEAVLAQIKSQHHPTPDYIQHFYQGKFFPDWYQQWQKQ